MLGSLENKLIIANLIKFTKTGSTEIFDLIKMKTMNKHRGMAYELDIIAFPI